LNTQIVCPTALTVGFFNLPAEFCPKNAVQCSCALVRQKKIVAVAQGLPNSSTNQLAGTTIARHRHVKYTMEKG
jgi:hypothetical protein